MDQTEQKKTNCLRCGRVCVTSAPDPAALALVRSATVGLCVDCAVTSFMLGIEVIADLINGSRNQAGLGPEALRSASLRECWKSLLALTQVRPEEIDWERVIAQWALPWPKGHEPRL